MKLKIAAAAIAFSGTAMMLTPSAASAAQQDMKPAAHAKAGWQDDGVTKADWTDSGVAGGKAGMAEMSQKAGLQTAKLESLEHRGMGGPLEDDGTSAKLGSLDAGGKAAMDTGSEGKAWAAGGDMGGKFASADMGGKGGLALNDMAGKSGLAMGGPEEEMASSAKQAGDRDSSNAVNVAAVAKETAAPGAVMGAGKVEHAGVGGPEEATTDYPPCRPGRGDDRCIQLYEVKARRA